MSARPRHDLRAPSAGPDGATYSIGELVALTSVPVSSIHHYRRLGLVPEPVRAASNRFIYDERHVSALRVIRSMRKKGASLADVRLALPEILGDRTESIESAVEKYLTRGDRGPGPRRRLIDAAIDEFAARGYRDVTISDLCDEAGIAKGTFYRHFDNKDDLFVTAATTIIERAIDGFESDAAVGEEEDHVVFARHLRHGLPVLLELAKQSIQDAGVTADAAAGLFRDLADRLGRAMNGDDPPAEGAFVIMMAVVEIFMGLVEPPSGAGAG